MRSFNARLIGTYLLSVFAVFIVFSMCGNAIAGSLNIVLKNSIQMDKSEVLLGDVARINAEDIELKNRLENVFIMKSPMVGYVAKISLVSVQRLVFKNHEFRKLNLKFTGSENIQVHSKGRKYKYAELIKLAKDKLFKDLKTDDRDVVLSVDKSKDTINVPFGALDFKTRINTDRISSRMCVWIDIYRKGGFYSSVPVWVGVKVFTPAYVAKNHIEKRQVITEQDFIIERKDIAIYAGKHIEVGAFNDRLLASKSISHGEVLRKDYIKAVPAVVAGVVLKALVTEGSVSIQVNAIARKDAEIGEIVKIKSLQGGGMLKAKVIGEQLVEVI